MAKTFAFAGIGAQMLSVKTTFRADEMVICMVKRQISRIAVAMGSACLLALAAAATARAEDGPSLKGQSVSLLIGFAAGGGVDATGRVMAAFVLASPAGPAR